jgi:hypothetical protein
MIKLVCSARPGMKPSNWLFKRVKKQSRDWLRKTAEQNANFTNKCSQYNTLVNETKM